MRLISLAVAVLLAATAMLLPEVREPEPGAQVGREAPAVAVCALQEGAGRSSRVSVLSTVDGPGRLTSFAGGQTTASVEFETGSHGSEAIDMVDVAAVGTVGGLIELPIVSSAVGTMVTGAGSIAAESCATTPAPQAFITGGSTLSGEEFELHLMNPYAGEAIVQLVVRSEVGVETSEALTSVVVPPRSSTIVDFDSVLPGREELSITINTERGSVIGVGRQRIDGESALWNAVPGAQDWYLPVPGGGEGKTLWIGTPAGAEVDFQVDHYGPEGLEEAFESGTIQPRGRAGVDLASITPETAGVRVIATGPVVPTLWIDSDAGLAATVGVTELATTWLLPGAGAPEEGSATLVVMNPGVDQTVVSYRPLRAGATLSEVALASEEAVEIELGPADGYRVESTGPTVVLWTARSEGAGAVSTGVPLLDG